MVSRSEFLYRVDEIVNEQPKYRKGGDGSDGTCDCIGLIIGPLRRAGAKWTGSHGSNYAARNEVEDLKEIVSTSDLELGEVVFKRHKPGEKGYDADTINKSYAKSKDKNDYYHVGIVISVYPLRIAHCTTPTTKVDTKLGAWSCHGRLKKVDYDEEGGGTQMATATIYAEGGGTVKVRATPSSSERLYWNYDTGTKVNVVNKGTVWSEVEAPGHTGYIRTEFLKFDEDPAGSGEIDFALKEEILNKVDEFRDWIVNKLGGRG